MHHSLVSEVLYYVVFPVGRIRTKHEILHKLKQIFSLTSQQGILKVIFIVAVFMYRVLTFTAAIFKILVIKKKKSLKLMELAKVQCSYLLLFIFTAILIPMHMVTYTFLYKTAEYIYVCDITL